MNTLLILSLFITAIDKGENFQTWFSKSMTPVIIGFILFGVIDIYIIVTYFKLIY